MKTPQQIIDALPEGNRKRACQMLAENAQPLDERTLGVWACIDAGQYAEAAGLLSIICPEKPHTSAVYADMIWEG